MIRGDSLPIKFLLKGKDDKIFSKEEIESIFITCRRYPEEVSPIIFQKSIDDCVIGEDGYVHVVIEPKDTENAEYGMYFVDTEITLKNGYKKTKTGYLELEHESTIAKKAGE